MFLPKTLAEHIISQVTEVDSYQTHLDAGNDPRDHIFYKAYQVLGWEWELWKDICEYKNRIKKETDGRS